MSISPTSFALLQRCPRAWWYTYRAKRPRVSTFALDNGSAVHTAVEHYLDTGAWPEGDHPAVVQARRAEAVLDAWQDTAGLRTGDGWAVVEASARRSLVEFGGVDDLAGRVDWHGTYDHDEDGPDPDGSTAWVIDHKTTANPSFWRTPEALATDPQLLAYAGALFPGRDVVVGHIYIPAPPTEPTLVLSPGPVSAAAIDAVLRDYAAGTVAAAAVRLAESAEAVEARTAGCWAFGGCAHADICTAAPEALRRRHHPTLGADGATTPNQNGVPMLTPAQIAMRAKMRGEAPPTETPVSAPVEAPVSAPAAEPTQDTSAAAAAPQTPTPANDGGIAPPDAPAAPAATTDASDDLAAAHGLAGVLTGITTPKDARALLCKATGRKTIKASDWTRIVEAGLTAGLWAINGAGELIVERPTETSTAADVVPDSAPSILDPAFVDGLAAVAARAQAAVAASSVRAPAPPAFASGGVVDGLAAVAARASDLTPSPVATAYLAYAAGRTDPRGGVVVPLYLYDSLVRAFG